MTLLGVTTYPALLWGICVFFAVESLTAPIPEPSDSTVVASTVTYSEKELQPATQSPTHKPAEVSVAAATKKTVRETNSLSDSRAGLVVKSTAAATAAAATAAAATAAAATAAATAATSGSDHRLLHNTTAATTAASEAQLSHFTTITETDKHTQDQFHQQSTTTFINTTAPAATSAAFTATAVAMSPQPTSIIKSEVTSQLSTTVSSQNQNLSSSSASNATTMTTNSTSKAAPVFNLTSSPVTTTETSKTSTELSSTSHRISTTSILVSTAAAGSSSTPTSISTNPPNSTVSNSSAGILIPRKPKRLPVTTFKPRPATTTAPHQVTKSPSSTETQPCSTRGVVKNCLIVISALAALATVFMVSTIVLCTRLSARKYRVKKPQQATEMMCISSLLPEPSYTYTRQRNPVRNGVRVILGGGDSDDDLGDNLTLSSFLPENDRSV